MRVLLVGLFPTHLMPMVPLTWALRAQGHEVLVAGNDGVVARARSAGLTSAVVADPPRQAPSGAAATRQAGAAPGALDWTAMEHRWRVRVDAVVDAHLDVARAFAPDLILCDPIEFSGLIVGGVLGVPVVVHRWGADRISSQSLPRAAHALAEIGARRGLTDGVPAPALVLDPCPPSLQCPDAAAAQPIRFVPPGSAGTVEPWLADRAAARRLTVSFGSETPLLAEPQLWNALVEAVTGIDALETVVTGRPSPGGRTHPLVRADGPAPLDLLLATSSALLHHGGSGTCLTGLWAGRPQIVHRQAHPSYAAHAERIEACGAGREIDLTGAHRDPARLRAVIEDVLSDPRYSTAAESLQAEMLAQPTPAAIVPLLADLAGVPV